MHHKLLRTTKKQLSRNFNAMEFVCHCGCDESIISFELIRCLQKVRNIIELPIIILSGYRCKKHNRKIGGALKSQHLLGNAADITVVGKEIDELYNICDPYFTGLARYDYKGFIHCDVRKGYWRANY